MFARRLTIENAVAGDDRLTVYGRGDVDYISLDRATGDKVGLSSTADRVHIDGRAGEEETPPP